MEHVQPFAVNCLQQLILAYLWSMLSVRYEGRKYFGVLCVFWQAVL